MFGPEGIGLLSLYHMAVASGMAAMLQVSVTGRPVRTRWGPFTDVTRAGSALRAESTDTDRYSKQHGSTNWQLNPKEAVTGEVHAYKYCHYSGLVYNSM